MKIAFLGFDFFYSSLENLVLEGYEFCWLYTVECDNHYNFNEKVIRLANKQNVKINYEPINKDDIQQLTKEGCDLIISAAYPFKIPIIDNMPPAVNIHPTYLPEGRGPWPLPWIILKGLNKSGVTIHKINSSFDAGELLIQDKFDVRKNENLETLSCKAQMLATKLLIKLLDNFSYYWDNSTVQLAGSYWPMPTFEQRELNWTLPVKEIDKIARAFGKFDSFATFESKEWIVQDITVWEEKHNFTPGYLVHRTNKEVVISAIDGLVCLRYYKIDPDFDSK